MKFGGPGRQGGSRSRGGSRRGGGGLRDVGEGTYGRKKLNSRVSISPAWGKGPKKPNGKVKSFVCEKS